MRNIVRQNTNRERAWKVMRGLRKFTSADVATVADVPAENIKHWIQCLVHAGYLRITGKKKQAGRPGTENLYMLVKNTGSKPPIQKDLRFIFDPNNGEYWAENPETIAHITSSIETGTEAPDPLLPPITGKIKLGSGVRVLCPRKKSVTHANE